MSNNITTAETTTPQLTTEITTTDAVVTTTEVLENGKGGMSTGEITGVAIGAIIAICIIGAISFVLLLRYRAKRKKETDKYNKTVKTLKLDKLPSPSEVENEELRPPERFPTQKPKKPEIEEDFSSSTKHYQNVPDLKYENVEKEQQEQPLYLEPQQAEKRLYATAAGSEYYVVEEPGKVPKLPGRDDDKNQKQNVNSDQTKQKNGNRTKQKSKANTGQKNPKTKTNLSVSNVKEEDEESSSSSDSDSSAPKPHHSAKDYVNLKEEKILPPSHIAKRQKPDIQQTLIIDDVYENEEIPKSPRSKTKR